VVKFTLENIFGNDDDDDDEDEDGVFEEFEDGEVGVVVYSSSNTKVESRSSVGSDINCEAKVNSLEVGILFNEPDEVEAPLDGSTAASSNNFKKGFA
jgi:hypothetical protein